MNVQLLARIRGSISHCNINSAMPSHLNRSNRLKKRKRAGAHNNKSLRGECYALLRSSENITEAEMGSQLRELTRLVKKEWPRVHKELGYAPPVHRTDCGTRLALTASNYKYLEGLRYKMQALVEWCWESLKKQVYTD